MWLFLHDVGRNGRALASWTEVLPPTPEVLAMIDESERSHQDDPVCPWCGRVDHEPWDHDWDDTWDASVETTCGSCEGVYRIERHVSVSYSTKQASCLDCEEDLPRDARNFRCEKCRTEKGLT